MKPIAPCLWFDMQAEDAVRFYTSLFANSRVVSTSYYPDQELGGPPPGMKGKVLTQNFELAGQPFIALNGGDDFKFTPAISLFVNCETEAEANALWARLSEGGEVLVPFDSYPFSQKFGWANDKYGLSWQVNLGALAQKITPFLMFVGAQHGRAAEAVNLYTSLFLNATLENVQRYGEGEGGEPGTVQHAVFQLAGQDLMAMDSNQPHQFTFTEALSLYVECADQAEVDQLWAALSADPGAEQCGWLKDKFGVSWQIIPAALPRLMNDPDPAKSLCVMEAMLQMKKIDVAELERAYAGSYAG